MNDLAEKDNGMGNQEEEKEESKSIKEEVSILTKDQLSRFRSNIKHNSYTLSQIELAQGLN